MSHATWSLRDRPVCTRAPAWPIFRRQANQPQHGTSDLQLVAQRQIFQSPQRPDHMQWRGQPPRGAKVAAAAVGPEEVQHAMPFEEDFDLRPAAEVEEVDAAAHRHVLAVIDPLARRLILV